LQLRPLNIGLVKTLLLALGRDIRIMYFLSLCHHGGIAEVHVDLLAVCDIDDGVFKLLRAAHIQVCPKPFNSMIQDGLEDLVI
jgi:hypothetical protein